MKFYLNKTYPTESQKYTDVTHALRYGKLSEAENVM